MSVSIKIFQIDVPAIGPFSAWCVDGEQPFLICSEGLHWQVSLDDASKIGRAAAAIVSRFEWADQTGKAPKAGPVYKKVSPDGVVVFELGIEAPEYSDPAIVFEFAGAPRVRLPGERGSELLRALLRLGAQASLVRAASPGAGNSLGLASSGPGSGNPLAGLHARLEKLAGW